MDVKNTCRVAPLTPARTSALTVLACLLVCATGPREATAEPAGNSGVQITTLSNRLRVEINGQLFTEYHFKDVPKPVCYPFLGPGNVAMTRHWPMTEVEGEDRDHPHHRSFWFAHEPVNGHNFWSESRKPGRIVHDEFVEIKSGQDAGVIRSRQNWVAPDGTIVCTDERILRIHNRSTGRLLDFDITIFASEGDVTFGDSKEGTMAVRVAETMRLKGKVAQGHIVNSEGDRDGDAWGKRAAWCDYHGPVEGRTVGIAMFDHPQNPRHPTWWHVRDYGLFAANPFGVHDFEKKPAGTGDFTIPKGKSATFRYRFYLHEGDEKQANVAGEYQAYIAADLPKSK